MPELASDRDGAPVGGNDGFGDGEAHAGAPHLIAHVPAAIELVKDQALFERIDARSTVRDRESNEVSAQLCGNGDGLIFGGIQMGVVNELGKNVFCAAEVRAHWGQVLVDMLDNLPVTNGLLHMLQSGIHDAGNGNRFEVQLDFPGFETRHFRCFLNQMIEPVALLIDDREEFVLLWVLQRG